MFAQEIDLFKGLGPDFMNELSGVAREKSHKADEVIFGRGQGAETLYILQKGRISLFIEEEGSIHFLVDQPGDVFGWSALVEPNVYTASARCYEDCTMLALDSTAMEHIFDRFPREGLTVMKRLAGVVAQRLTASYEVALSSGARDATPSYG